jgi:hypothetical protein
MGYLRITAPDGRVSEHSVLADTTIGSGPTARVRLEVPGLGPEHVLVSPQGEKLWISTAQGAAPVLYQGRVLAGGYVPWGSEIEVLGIRIELKKQPAVIPEEIAGNLRSKGGDIGSTERKSNPLLFAVAAIALLVLVMNVISKDARGAQQISEQPVKLFRTAEPCNTAKPESGGDAAARAALASEERYDFDPHAGVAAVGLFRDAASCFAAAGRAKLNERLLARAAEVQKRIETDVQAHRLRLSRALEAEDRPAALRHLAFLRAVARHQPKSRFAVSLRHLQVSLMGAEGDTP